MYPWLDYYLTVNKRLLLDSSFNVVESDVIIEPKIIINYEESDKYKYIVGVEDIKLFNVGNKVIYTATGVHQNGSLGTLIGDYPSSGNGSLTVHELKYSQRSVCEKNWVLFPSKNNEQFKVIYKWYPITIGDLVDNEFIKTHEIVNIPPLFKNARGSSNGFLFNDELWFIVHYIHKSDNEPRNYYHSIVVLGNPGDGNYTLNRYTKPFKFNTSHNEIEYSLGLIVEPTRVIITHSVWDRESYIKIYSLDYIESLLYKE